MIDYIVKLLLLAILGFCVLKLEQWGCPHLIVLGITIIIVLMTFKVNEDYASK